MVRHVRFHGDDYVNFLQIITQDNMQHYVDQLQWFNIVEDCPVSNGLFHFCQLDTLDSMEGAAQFMPPLERKHPTIGIDSIFPFETKYNQKIMSIHMYHLLSRMARSCSLPHVCQILLPP